MLKEEFLWPAGVSQRTFARQLGWTPARLSELINGKRGITVDAALELAARLRTSPDLWLHLQMLYDLHRAEARRQKAS
jgi:addiction module HigA family antidote